MYDKDDRPNRITFGDVMLMILGILLVIALIGGAGYGLFKLVVHLIAGA